MTVPEWDSISVEEFWKTADKIQNDTLLHAKDLFSFAEQASPKALFSLLVQYRFFTIYYTSDLAILVSRMEDGKMRSFIGDILSDELGYGDPQKAHPSLYDDFLRSLNISDENLDDLALTQNIALLDKDRKGLVAPEKSSAYGVGLRGMGGECVCQIYLSQLYDHIMKNPYIQQHKDSIDWKFWELHVGDHDIQHRIQTRQLIQDEVVKSDAEMLSDLWTGYCDSMNSWKIFWDNIFQTTKQEHAKETPAISSRTSITYDLNFRDLSKDNESISQFHLAIPVRDLEQARHFYRDVLGAQEGRSTYNHIDFNLYGHHFVIHVAPEGQEHLFDSFESDFHGEVVKTPHFGINMDHKSWSILAERVKQHNHTFFDAPHVRLSGEPGEHATFFILDPSNNALEFKAFRNHDEVFSKVFDANSTDPFALDTLVQKAHKEKQEELDAVI